MNKSIDTLIPIGLIVTELINNSMKHAFNEDNDKEINLSVKHINNDIVFTYQDNGKGFDNQVLNSSDELESFGITIIRSLIEQLNGKIKFSNNNGAQVELTIPVV